MNREQLIYEAKIAVKLFRKLNNCTCFLRIIGGKVQTLSAKDAPRRYPQSLFISVVEQNIGLSDSQWNQIGKILLTQHTKEKSCQKPPKP